METLDILTDVDNCTDKKKRSKKKKVCKTKFFNVTCHFFWTKGWSLFCPHPGFKHAVVCKGAVKI